jgi:hypothetical protein
MDRLKMAALDEIYGWACFDEEQDLSRLVNSEEIRDGLLDTVVEKVEVFAVKTANELPARVGDDDSDVDAVHTDVVVGWGLGGLLAKSGGRKQEGARDREKCAASRGKKHSPIWHRRMAAKKTEAPSRAKFPERGTGLAISS